MGNVSPVEALWVLINTVTLVLTITALADARADRIAVRLLNGIDSKARELAATGIVRREVLRVISQVMLVSVAVPGLFFADGEDRPFPLRFYPVAALIAVALLLLYQSFTDARERKRLTVLVVAEAASVKKTDMAEIKEMVQTASDNAEKAYHEANSVNSKIARQGAALVAQGIIQADDRETADETAAQMKVTLDDTHGRVVGIDERTGGGT